VGKTIFVIFLKLHFFFKFSISIKCFHKKNKKNSKYFTPLACYHALVVETSQAFQFTAIDIKIELIKLCISVGGTHAIGSIFSLFHIKSSLLFFSISYAHKEVSFYFILFSFFFCKRNKLKT
jgi:hypothetical protein